MVAYFFMDGNTVGCDFCGIVETAGSSSSIPPGTRVSGADFPYRRNNPYNGAFAQYAVLDSRHALKVPDNWSDLQAAALGTAGWGTSCLALADPEALNLQARPSSPAEKAIPVLVYGGATATGIIAIQMLRMSGYRPIAVCSDASAAAVRKYGAVGTASYMSPTCLETIKSLAGGVPIKHAFDCITNRESVALCYGALARIGGRYACLEDCPELWRTRRAVKAKVVMGYEGQNVDVDLAHPVYTRKANPELHAVTEEWAKEMQALLDQGKISTQEIQEVAGGFDGVIEAMEMLARGTVRGRKLVVRIAE
jgi:NADPH:quinone reductase-like Zn-dependent oxidoreductase